jgi:hypothetical protein
MFVMDQSFQEAMMGELDWSAIIRLGMAQKGSHVPDGYKCDFKEDFADAYFAAKEQRFLERQKGEKRDDVSGVLATRTHSRMVKIFSKIGAAASAKRGAASEASECERRHYFCECERRHYFCSLGRLL